MIRRIHRPLTALLDGLMIAAFLVTIAVMVSGGWNAHLLGLNVSATYPRTPATPMLILLVARKLLDWRTPVGGIPLVLGVYRVLAWIGRRAAARPRIVLGAMVVGYAAAMSAIVCMRHFALLTHAYDLGIFDQLMWSAANGRDLSSSILGRHFLGEHFSPILYLLVPGYWLWQDPRYLLVLQTLALSVAAVPLYVLARREMESAAWGLLFAAVYLAYRPMQYVNLYDFHEIALTTPLLFLAFLLLHRRRYGAFALVLCAALACKEEVAEAVCVMGVYVAWVHRRRALGATLAVAGLMIFLLLIQVVIPYFRNGSYGFVSRYAYLGTSVPAIIGTLLAHPLQVVAHVATQARLEYLKEVFTPLALLSFASPTHLLLATPTLAQNLLSDFPPQFSTTFQYTAPLTPFVFVAAVFGAKNVRSIARRFGRRATPGRPVPAPLSSLVAIVLLVTLAVSGRFPLRLLQASQPTPYTRYVCDEVFSRIPPDAAVSACDVFVPHLSRRRDIHVFPVVDRAEYVLLDSRNREPVTDGSYFERVRALARGGYTVAWSDGALLLLHRTVTHHEAGADSLPAAFLRADRPRGAKPEASPTIHVGL